MAPLKKSDTILYGLYIPYFEFSSFNTSYFLHIYKLSFHPKQIIE